MDRWNDLGLSTSWGWSAKSAPISVTDALKKTSLESIRLEKTSWLHDDEFNNFVYLQKRGAIYLDSLPVLRLTSGQDATWCITFPSIVPVQTRQNRHGEMFKQRFKEPSEGVLVGRYLFPNSPEASPLTAGTDGYQNWTLEGKDVGDIHPLYTLKSNRSSYHTYQLATPELIEPLSTSFDYSEHFEKLMTRESVAAVNEMCSFLEGIKQASGIRVAYGASAEREVQVGYFSSTWTTQAIRRHFASIVRGW
jgi:hypothetical protein